jgi:flagellar motor switch protein FliM
VRGDDTGQQWDGMATQDSGTVIHKKARHARAGADARGMSPSKALRLALERACDGRLRLPLAVRAVEQRRVPRAELEQMAGADCLLLLIEGQGVAPGVVLVDRATVQALVEVQTVGAVRSSPPPNRPFTNTDAAIAAPLVDATLEGYDGRMADAPEAPRRAGYRFADRVADARALTLVLEEPAYELFRLTCDIGPGARTGELTVALPPAALAPPAPTGAGAAAARFDLSELAMTAPVTLDAVLDRVELPLSRVMELAPGMAVPVDAGAIARTELVAARGHVAAVVRLGQMNGFRAVRLCDGAEPAAAPAAASGKADAQAPAPRNTAAPTTAAPPAPAPEGAPPRPPDTGAGQPDMPEPDGAA